MRIVLATFLLAVPAVRGLGATEVRPETLVSYTHPKLGMTVLEATVRLPRDRWQVVDAGSGLRHVFLDIVAENELRRYPGKRLRHIALGRKNRSSAAKLHRINSTLRRLAGHGNPARPRSPAEWETELERQLATSPWPDETEIEGPFYFRIPGVEIPEKWTQERVPMVLEIRPYVDDGKHHVLHSNGAVSRVEIDRQLLGRHGLKILPVVPAAELEAEPESLQSYRVLALSLAGGDASVSRQHEVRLAAGSGKERTALVSLEPSRAVRAEQRVFRRWVELRSRDWSLQARQAPSSVLPAWLARHEALYGHRVGGGSQRGPDVNAVTAFGVLGGRAAIRETLQLQAIDGASGRSDEERTVLVSSIPGVQVKSHPYEEMLAGREGGRLPLADHVPHDRFLVYFSRPAAVAAYLDGGTEFLFQTSRTVNGSSLAYDLKARYFARLGLSSDWVRRFLESDAVAEMALVFPDLFFIDGTEVSAILRVPRLERLKPLLALIGVRGLSAGEIVERRLLSGRKVVWAARGDLLFVGTHRGELEDILALGDKDGEGSLGRSAEFRYMLTKLDVRPTTRAFAYLSDPFIRRLVGPEVKIGQLRRIRARADLESLSAGALLYRADGNADVPSVDRLAELGYVPQHATLCDYRLDSDLVAHSERRGTPSDMDSLLEVEVEKVTDSEAKAYRAYVENYSRFWRQFFDPIAVRLDDADGGGLELEVFILPLIDSSIYNTVRRLVVPRGSGQPLQVPSFEPEPVLMLSLNLREEAWMEVFDDFEDAFRQFGLPVELVEELGPSLHLAVLDGDPVLNLGSGDILGAFGANFRGGWFGRSEMFFVPALLSMFTRPCKVLVELRDSERVLEILRDASVHIPSRQRWGFSYDLARLGDRDSWILTVDIFGFAKLRLGIEVDGGFLIVSNIPWTAHSRFHGLGAGHLDSGLLQVTPGAGTRQLPGLFTTAMEKERRSAYESAGHLFPLMLAGASDLAAARAWHHRMLGFAPVHPSPGEFRWEEGRVTSDRFGSLHRQRQPPYREGNTDFGLLRRVHSLRLSFQLEDDGLRTRVHWRLRKGAVN
ncbi:MAG: hypothetical protein O7J95_06485 [Planctomycetota bacterium]|nr:hypothetical protein [Planctomycetota bacterium]